VSKKGKKKPLSTKKKRKTKNFVGAGPPPLKTSRKQKGGVIEKGRSVEKRGGGNRKGPSVGNHFERGKTLMGERGNILEKTKLHGGGEVVNLENSAGRAAGFKRGGHSLKSFLIQVGRARREIKKNLDHRSYKRKEPGLRT